MSAPRPRLGPGSSPPPIPVAPNYAWYPAPPKEEWPVLLIIIVLVVIVVFVVLPIVLGAALFGFGGGFTGSAPGPREFFLGPVDQSNGNASVPIYAFLEPLDPGSLRFTLEADDAISAETALPPSGGSAAVVVGGHALHLFWLDPTRDGLLGTDDVFWITGDRSPLPPAMTIRFSMGSEDASTWESVVWTTGPA